MFNIPQANFKSAHLLNKMALIQFQSNRTVIVYIKGCTNFHLITVNQAIFKVEHLKSLEEKLTLYSPVRLKLNKGHFIK